MKDKRPDLAKIKGMGTSTNLLFNEPVKKKNFFNMKTVGMLVFVALFILGVRIYVKDLDSANDLSTMESSTR